MMATIIPNNVLKSDFFSLQPPLRIALSGQDTIQNETVTIPHGLSYIPMVKIWAYQKSATELGNYQQVSTFLTWHYGFVSTPDLTWYVTDTNLVVTNSINGAITFIYRIYYND